MDQSELITELNKLFIGISKVALSGELRTKQMVNQLRYWHTEIANQTYPNSSISDLNQITGLPRATISDFLEDEKPVIVKDTLAVLLSVLWEHSENGFLELKGDVSFYSIASKRLGSTFSPQTALNKLIQLNAVELKDNGIQLISEYLNVSNSLPDTLSKLSQFALWLIETALYNSEVKDKEKQLFQRSYYTTKVPDSDIPKLHSDVITFTREAYAKLKEIIDRYEIDVDEDTFKEYGVTISEFSSLFSNNKSNKV